MTPAAAREAQGVLEATLRALQDRDWDALSDRLVDVRTGRNVPASTLRVDFDGIRLEDFDVLDVEAVTPVRCDADVELRREWRDADVDEAVGEVWLTLFRVGDDGRTDEDGTWTVTNTIELRLPGADQRP